jgi:hypothetical protein
MDVLQECVTLSMFCSSGNNVSLSAHGRVVPAQRRIWLYNDGGWPYSDGVGLPGSVSGAAWERICLLTMAPAADLGI